MKHLSFPSCWLFFLPSRLSLHCPFYPCLIRMEVREGMIFCPFPTMSSGTDFFSCLLYSFKAFLYSLVLFFLFFFFSCSYFYRVCISLMFSFLSFSSSYFFPLSAISLSHHVAGLYHLSTSIHLHTLCPSFSFPPSFDSRTLSDAVTFLSQNPPRLPSPQC